MKRTPPSDKSQDRDFRLIHENEDGMIRQLHENDALTGTLETWEQTVFDNAAVFRVTVMRGMRNHDTRDFTKFPDALECAKAHQPRVMLYAITCDERNFCIPPKQWAAYMERRGSTQERGSR